MKAKHRHEAESADDENKNNKKALPTMK